jgi:hypothetical protein
MIRSKWREPQQKRAPAGYISKVNIPTDPVPAIEAGVDFSPAEVKPSVEQASRFTQALFLSEVIEPSV